MNLGFAGRGSSYTHKDSRRKHFKPNTYVSVTGDEAGLRLQFYPKGKLKVSIPKGKSFVTDPLGNKVPIDFAERANKELGWRGKFAAPLNRVQGLYTYHIVFKSNGKTHKFTHHIDYSFVVLGQGKYSGKQIDG